MLGLFKYAIFTLLSLAFSSLQAGLTVTDIAGRHVTLEAPVERCVISEGRYVTTLAGVVGMMSPIAYSNPTLEAYLFKHYPEARDITLFGRQDENSVSVEKIIDLAPQLAIFGIQNFVGALQRCFCEMLDRWPSYWAVLCHLAKR